MCLCSLLLPSDFVPHVPKHSRGVSSQRRDRAGAAFAVVRASDASEGRYRVVSLSDRQHVATEVVTSPNSTLLVSDGAVASA
jgi:hypothetical protein